MGRQEIFRGFGAGLAKKTHNQIEKVDGGCSPPPPAPQPLILPQHVVDKKYSGAAGLSLRKKKSDGKRAKEHDLIVISTCLYMSTRKKWMGAAAPRLCSP